MFIKNWKKEILTVPNLLSLLRLVLIPVYVSIYRNAQTPRDHLLAGAVLAASCLTDAADGFIARTFHMVSRLGKLLDPLADKCTQLALTLCLCGKYPVLKAVLVLFAVKELSQLVLCIHAIRSGNIPAGALPAGKVCTAVLFVGLIFLVLVPAVDSRIVMAIAVTDCVFLALSFGSYTQEFLLHSKNP